MQYKCIGCDIGKLKERIDGLEKELARQCFSNKHNLSIDQKVADRVEELEKQLEEAKKELRFYGLYTHYVFPKDKDTKLTAIDIDGGKRARKYLDKYRSE